ncbi:unnamed protein product [Fraxinus pennsylvanica]|uniref:Uncharacterized protein n=1 Tax=Fraxinus pennsylvanica TaxID=56036 RepID=A0AAD2DUK5_9LAMI|nr:unnamed protein product [Fraxinus pennsylvanica]
MSQLGHVSAVNLRGQNNLNNLWSSQSWRCYCLCGKMNTLSFASSDAMGSKLKSPAAHAFMTRSGKDVSPLKVVCIDYPRPGIESSVNYLEAAYLPSTFRNSPRPYKPLKIVIVGAEAVNVLKLVLEKRLL